MSVTLEGAVPCIPLMSILGKLGQKETAEGVAKVWGRKVEGLMKSGTGSEGKNHVESYDTTQ